MSARCLAHHATLYEPSGNPARCELAIDPETGLHVDNSHDSGDEIMHVNGPNRWSDAFTRSHLHFSGPRTYYITEGPLVGARIVEGENSIRVTPRGEGDNR